jgi:hypothetical protein
VLKQQFAPRALPIIRRLRVIGYQNAERFLKTLGQANDV